MIDIEATAADLLSKARESAQGRAASTVVGGADSVLRQTVVAITAGTNLAEHESPGEATVLVLRGEVTLEADGESEHAAHGQLLVVPDRRHGLHADADAVVVLTVAKAEVSGGR